jgi:hypothetical protein
MYSLWRVIYAGPCENITVAVCDSKEKAEELLLTPELAGQFEVGEITANEIIWGYGLFKENN